MMDQAGPSEDKTTKICQLCNARPRVYTCPRCAVGYCNVECYKSDAHLDCSESFYKQCVEEELKTQESDPESRKRMIEILKRVRERDFDGSIFDPDDRLDEEEEGLDSDDDENIPDLEERLQNVNLDNANEIWSALTDSERQEFEALVKNGEAEKLLPQWVPWWTHVKEQLIQDLDKEEETEEYIKECPVLIDVPIFNELQKASRNVSYNLVNVICAYAYMALYYNGDYLNCADEAATVFLDICDNMKSNKVFSDVESAKDSVIQNVTNCDWLPQDEQTIVASEEAGNSIIHGPAATESSLYISAALSELHRLLTAAKEQISAQKKQNKDFSKRFSHKSNVDKATLSKKNLLLCCKKLEYYLSWTKSYGSTLCL